jgi:type IV pilus assembly protein PilP
MTIFRLLVCACGLAAATAAAAEQPQAPPPQAQTGAPAAAAPTQSSAAPAAPQSYSYDPQGRRDPFQSLLARGADPKSVANRPSGVPGLLISEVTVKGIVRDRSGFIAMIQGPDSNKTFTVRTGERLMDGSVKAITADGVVFSQDVNDPLSMVKQKEVRKTVRPIDGGRG